MKFQRSYIKVLKKRILNEERKFIQVIYGPRQVGKTTLVNQFLQSTEIPSHFATADGIVLTPATWISQQWEVARLKKRQAGSSQFLLVIDEIQKIDNWSEYVKKEWDQDNLNGVEVKVIILGSSRLLIQKGLTESLAGRFEAIYVGHWSYTEMEAAFGISEAEFVWFGGYPGATFLFEEEDRWKRYVRDALIETSISKDILMMTRVAKPALMKRLFEFGCLYSGQILSLNKILGQLTDAGNTTTLSHYLKLLDTAGLLGSLGKYSKSIIQKKSSSPRFQVHNTALISALSERSFKEVSESPTDWGRWVKSAIGAYLLNDSLKNGYELFYWREGDQEVDFVLKYKDQIIGIEVKSGFGKLGKGFSAFKRAVCPT
ncbi:MAG: ATP-binding protein, partial [Bacteroidota bacterium]